MIIGTTVVGSLILLAIVVALLAFYLYRRSTKHHTISKKQSSNNDEAIYADIDNKRGSKAYSSFKGQNAPPDLSTTLESVCVNA